MLVSHSALNTSLNQIDRAYQVHKQRLKNIKKCVDNDPPTGYEEFHGKKSPIRKVMAKNGK